MWHLEKIIKMNGGQQGKDSVLEAKQKAAAERPDSQGESATKQEENENKEERGR